MNRIGLHPLVCKCQKAFSFRRDAWHSQVKEDNFDSESAGDGIYEVALNRRSFFFGVTSLGSVCQTPAQAGEVIFSPESLESAGLTFIFPPWWHMMLHAADAKLPLTCVLDNSEGYSIGIPEGG